MKKLFALLVASLFVVFAPPSEAGCALTIVFKNDTNQAISVSQLDAKVVPVGTWATAWSGELGVPAGQERSIAVELKLGCSIEGGFRMLRAKYAQGDSSGWKTKGPVNTAVDRKITLRFE